MLDVNENVLAGSGQASTTLSAVDRLEVHDDSANNLESMVLTIPCRDSQPRHTASKHASICPSPFAVIWVETFGCCANECSATQILHFR